MSFNLLFFVLFLCSLIHLGTSVSYPCSTSYCSSGCCSYFSAYYAYDATCSTAGLCTCLASASTCAGVGITRAGTGNCSASTTCSSKCCTWSSTVFYNDTTCNSTYCSCSVASACVTTSTTQYPSGYQTCGCTGGCCYYYASSYVHDYYCNSSNCYCSSSYGYNYCTSSSTSTGYSYVDDWSTADSLSALSGNSYVVVSYSGWKAAVAVGAVIAGIWFFLDLYLLYYKCFQKPRNLVRP